MIAAALGLALATSAASGSAAASSVADAPCLQNAETNPEFSACTWGLVEEQDKRLNASWRKLFDRAGGSRTPAGRALLKEQRAWIAFRQAACKEYMLPTAGREAMVIHGPLCIARIIEHRADDLTGRFEDNN